MYNKGPWEVIYFSLVVFGTLMIVYFALEAVDHGMWLLFRKLELMDRVNLRGLVASVVKLTFGFVAVRWAASRLNSRQ